MSYDIRTVFEIRDHYYMQTSYCYGEEELCTFKEKEERYKEDPSEFWIQKQYGVFSSDKPRVKGLSYHIALYEKKEEATRHLKALILEDKIKAAATLVTKKEDTTPFLSSFTPEEVKGIEQEYVAAKEFASIFREDVCEKQGWFIFSKGTSNKTIEAWFNK